MANSYTPEEQTILLDLARQTLTAITHHRPPPDIDLNALPLPLRDERACFVTLRFHADGALRGCTGTLVARRPLAEEVVHMTGQTAFHDPRFAPVTAHEVPLLHIEISVLTPPQLLDFRDADDLLQKLRPNIDGVTLELNNRRATFLPQVWENYPDPRVFLSLLSQKMRLGPDAWQDPHMQVSVYQAIIIEEPT
ncbi:MAG: AmmeMemoRadiSam system protein A [Chloroflexi bacterium]|nr:AmmeMemoRadiSam system protein A [Chloroflexota bacterium]